MYAIGHVDEDDRDEKAGLGPRLVRLDKVTNTHQTTDLSLFPNTLLWKLASRPQFAAR